MEITSAPGEPGLPLVLRSLCSLPKVYGSPLRSLLLSDGSMNVLEAETRRGRIVRDGPALESTEAADPPVFSTDGAIGVRSGVRTIGGGGASVEGDVRYGWAGTARGSAACGGGDCRGSVASPSVET
eukprot:scaffold4687_cov117-Isochrysis_galbana.AAC.5